MSTCSQDSWADLDDLPPSSSLSEQSVSGTSIFAPQSQEDDLPFSTAPSSRTTSPSPIRVYGNGMIAPQSRGPALPTPPSTAPQNAPSKPLPQANASQQYHRKAVENFEALIALEGIKYGPTPEEILAEEILTEVKNRCFFRAGGFSREKCDLLRVMGALWDAELKLWHVPSGHMIEEKFKDTPYERIMLKEHQQKRIADHLLRNPNSWTAWCNRKENYKGYFLV
jgi:hypothetical protein